MHKIVNLDDERNSVAIKVEGKEFVISRIVLKARQLYGEYLKLSGEYLNLIAESQEKANSKDAKELEEVNAKLELAVEDYAFRKAEYIEELLEIILVKNGYDFDIDWWHDNTDYSVMESFVYQALKKDETGAPAKKKAEA
jgi:hypothetical protein